MWSGRLLWTVAAAVPHKEGGRAEPEQSLHTHPSFVVFAVCQRSCECLCLWDCLTWTRAGRKEKERERLREVVWERQLGVGWWKETLWLSQSLWRPRSDEMNPQYSTVMEPLKTPGRTKKEQSREMEKVDLGHNRKSHIRRSDYSFGLTALLSLRTTELYRRNLIEKLSRKGCTPKCASAYVCLFMSSLPHCFSWVSVKGYIDEQIARLQSVNVNEQSAHDIISLLTCAVIHLCLPWKTQADEEWREQGYNIAHAERKLAWTDGQWSKRQPPDSLPLVALFITFC